MSTTPVSVLLDSISQSTHSQKVKSIQTVFAHLFCEETPEEGMFVTEDKTELFVPVYLMVMILSKRTHSIPENWYLVILSCLLTATTLLSNESRVDIVREFFKAPQPSMQIKQVQIDVMLRLWKQNSLYWLTCFEDVAAFMKVKHRDENPRYPMRRFANPVHFIKYLFSLGKNIEGLITKTQNSNDEWLWPIEGHLILICPPSPDSTTTHAPCCTAI